MSATSSVHRLKLFLAAWLGGWALLAGGCGDREKSYPCPECPIPIARATPERACPNWRWIGILSDRVADCPRLADPAWTVRPLFEDPGGTPIPPGLSRFCLYEHQGAGADLTQEKLPGLIDIQRDCMAVLPAASCLVESAYLDLQRRFLFEAGGITDFPPQPPAGSPSVRLALLDTAPNSDEPAANPNNRSPHGYTLANMAKRLACAAGDCTATITARLALPWVVYEPSSRALSLRDDVRGGFVGMIGELAEASRAEVVAWQAGDAAKPLVLNLSVGWNVVFGGGEATVAAMPPAAQAVHAALADALCRGAAVIAAAGNLTWGPEVEPSEGPLLPAAWERRDAPIEDDCGAALEPGATVELDDDSNSSYRPLVHAVGAVAADNRPLGNARLEAEPRLVAFGDHGVVVGEGDGKPTAMLTGSSVSTLVTATTLTWVRAYRPGLDAFEAIDELHRHGQGSERWAAVCRGRKAGERCPPADELAVHRLVVGEVAFKACSACEGPDCSAPCPPWNGEAPPGLPPDAYECFANVRRVRWEELAAGTPSTHAACPPAKWRAALKAAGRQGAPERFHGGSAASVDRCPPWQFFDTSFHGLTGPQPGSEPCPSCGLGGGPGTGAALGTSFAPFASPLLAQPPPSTSLATAYIEIDENYLGVLSRPLLKVAENTYTLADKWPDLAPGAKLVITGIPVGPDEHLQLSFVVNATHSGTSLFLRTPSGPAE